MFPDLDRSPDRSISGPAWAKHSGCRSCRELLIGPRCRTVAYISVDCDVVSPGLGDDNRCSTKAVLVKVADVVVAMGMA